MSNLDKHGEYKVPGGKLVVIDLAVDDGHLQSVMLSGDFFLEPPEALEVITGALQGAPADAAEAELAARIESSLAANVAMIGFSAADVAIAVRRALS